MPEPTREWTLIFYFASDNPLAPSAVTQLKAIKSAGFHEQANVIVQFDPNEPSTPTHTFEVNHCAKRKSPTPNQVGDGGDPTVKSLLLDRLWEKTVPQSLREQLVAQLYQDEGSVPPEPPPASDEMKPVETLSNLLDFCRREYPARRYALFLLGHGLIVGNDIFLQDDNAADSSVSLNQLGRVLQTFTDGLASDAPAGGVKPQLELVSVHSCSMSSVEVAYELRGKANYMLAAQSSAFIGSWPYRQMLMRLFKGLDDFAQSDAAAQPAQLREMLVEMFHYTLYNSHDFQLAGYSFDVCLTNLNQINTPVKTSELPDATSSDTLTTRLKQLVGALQNGLKDEPTRQAILLSHWEAQSFWQEIYTDLYDFCLCLWRRLPESDILKAECFKVMEALVPGDKGVIVRSKFAGPDYQYAHGLSVYFPWARPTNQEKVLGVPPDKDTQPAVPVEGYCHYEFHQQTGWLDFLKEYWDITQRTPRRAEDATDPFAQALQQTAQERAQSALLEDLAGLVFDSQGALSGFTPATSLNNGDRGGSKANPLHPLGGLSCSVIKNYPSLSEFHPLTGPHGSKLPTSKNFFSRFPLT